MFHHIIFWTNGPFSNDSSNDIDHHKRKRTFYMCSRVLDFNPFCPVLSYRSILTYKSYHVLSALNDIITQHYLSQSRSKDPHKSITGVPEFRFQPALLYYHLFSSCSPDWTSAPYDPKITINTTRSSVYYMCANSVPESQMSVSHNSQPYLIYKAFSTSFIGSRVKVAVSGNGKISKCHKI